MGQIRAAILACRALVEAGTFRPALERAADATLKWMQREYTALSKVGWARISFLTYVLSRRRVQSPITTVVVKEPSTTGRRPLVSFQMLFQRVAKAPALIDTGTMRGSLVRGARYNIFEVGNASAKVGSRDPDLARHQKAHTFTPTFGRSEAERLARNVPPKVGGFWNPLFFALRAVLIKRAGRTVPVPARPLPLKPPANIVSRLRSDCAIALSRAVRRIIRR